MRRKRFGHALTVFQARTCHRYQELHRHVGRDRTAADLSLYALGKLIDQRQTARYPTQAAIKATRQLLQPIAETSFHLHQQPTLFQRTLLGTAAQRPLQQESFGRAHRPHCGFDRVSAQVLQRRYPLVSVDDQVSLAGLGTEHHHDWRLLARFSQRRHQSPLPLRLVDAQMFPAPLELVKLQLHRRLLGIQYA